MKKKVIPLVVSLALAYSVAFAGSLFTAGAVDTWYATLAKPDLNPPSWVFGPVWTVLYALMAVAAWRIYERRKENRRALQDLVVYAVHLVLNAFWSVAFFGLHTPALALGVIAVLWIFIAYLAVRFYRTDAVAGYLLLPYLVWVSFASYLNYIIWMLNS